MKLCVSTCAIIAIAGLSTAASAATIDLNYTGIVGGNDATRARIGSSTYLAGHMSHMIMSGDNAGQSFNTFCIEIAEYATPGTATYDIIDLADAPNPGSYYGQARADAVSAILANALTMGWIDSKMQATSETASTNRARMGAIQAAIWEALGHDFDLNSSNTSTTLRNRYSELMNENSFDDSLRMHGLRAVVAEGQQDMLYIVPLPTAGLAGLGMLGLCAGVRATRRR